MEGTLYILTLSHPAQAGRLMVEHKGIRARVVRLDRIAGFHHHRLRAAGFTGDTVPALVIDGRRVQGTRQIARFLDDFVPERPMLPADAEARAAVLEAEEWGAETLQSAVRAIAVGGLHASTVARRWFVGQLGLPPFLGPPAKPIVARLTRKHGIDPQVSRASLRALPALLDRVDGLIADGVLGSDERNAADFQIAPSVRFLLALSDVAPMVEDRPAAAHARAILADYAGPLPVGSVPADWLHEAQTHGRTRQPEPAEH